MGSGRLQCSWARVAFGDMVACVNDRIDNPVDAGVERYVGLEHLDSHSLTIRRWGVPSDVSSTKLRFRAGDIIFGRRRVYQRKLGVADFDGICSAHALVLRANPEVVVPQFLPFFMQTDIFMDRAKSISVGSLSPTINWTTLAVQEFSLPSLDEQRRMGNLLMGIQATSRALQDAHRALTMLRKSALVRSFGHLLADPAVRSVPVGELGEVLLGRQRAPQHESGPSMHPYLRVANVFDGYIDTADVKSMNFSSSEYERYKLRDGDVLLNEGQSRELVGRNAIFRGDVTNACFQNTLVRFRPGPLILSSYAHRYFQYCMYSGTFAAVAKQTTSIAHLGAQSLADLPIPLPSTNRQAELSGRLSAIDSTLPATADREKRLRILKARVSESLAGKSQADPDGTGCRQATVPG